MPQLPQSTAFAVSCIGFFFNFFFKQLIQLLTAVASQSTLRYLGVTSQSLVYVLVLEGRGRVGRLKLKLIIWYVLNSLRPTTTDRPWFMGR